MYKQASTVQTMMVSIYTRLPNTVFVQQCLLSKGGNLLSQLCLVPNCTQEVLEVQDANRIRLINNDARISYNARQIIISVVIRILTHCCR